MGVVIIAVLFLYVLPAALSLYFMVADMARDGDVTLGELLQAVAFALFPVFNVCLLVAGLQHFMERSGLLALVILRKKTRQEGKGSK